MFLVLHHLPSVKLVLASNPTQILIKWKMEANIFKMQLIIFVSIYDDHIYEIVEESLQQHDNDCVIMIL